MIFNQILIISPTINKPFHLLSRKNDLTGEKIKIKKAPYYLSDLKGTCPDIFSIHLFLLLAQENKHSLTLLH